MVWSTPLFRLALEKPLTVLSSSSAVRSAPMRLTDSARPTAAVPPPVIEPLSEAMVRPLPALASTLSVLPLPEVVSVLLSTATVSLPSMLLTTMEPPTPTSALPEPLTPRPQISPSRAEVRVAVPVRLTTLSDSFAVRSASIRLTATAPPTPALPPAPATLRATDQMLAPRSGWLAAMDRLRAVMWTLPSSASTVSAIRL